MSLTSCFIGAGENSNISIDSINQFPKMVGIDLEGKNQNLPAAFNGEFNIIALGFEREHQEAINTWIKVVDGVIEKNSNVKFFEIPIIYKLGGFSRAWINNGMRFGIPNEIARKRTITVYTDREKLFEAMQMKGDRIYVLILDNKANIIWRIQGHASKENIQSFEKTLKKLKINF